MLITHLYSLICLSQKNILNLNESNKKNKKKINK
jgi:hypothetical protein